MIILRQLLKKIPIIFIGSFFCAFGVAYFIQPVGLLACGCTGIAIALNHFTGLPLSLGIWAVSIGFFIWGFLALGTEFAISSLFGSIGYPLSYNITSWMASRTGFFTDDVFLCMVFAGICSGIGIGLILRVGASDGASDVPAVILNHKYGIPVSTTLYTLDGLILCLQMPFSEPQKVLYGLLYIAVYSMLTGKVVVFGQDRIQIQIISLDFEKINHAVLSQLNLGSTLVHIQGGYNRQETFAVQTVVTKRDLFRVRETALKIDPQAFLVINPVSEVNGRGFTLSRQYGKPLEVDHI